MKISVWKLEAIVMSRYDLFAVSKIWKKHVQKKKRKCNKLLTLKKEFILIVRQDFFIFLLMLHTYENIKNPVSLVK